MGVLNNNPINDFPVWEQAGFQRFGFTCWRKFITVNIELIVNIAPGYKPCAMFLMCPGGRTISSRQFDKGLGFDEIRSAIKSIYNIDICAKDGHIPANSILNIQIQALRFSSL